MAHEATKRRQIEMMPPDLRKAFDSFNELQKEAFFKIVDIENSKIIEVRLTLTASELRAICHLIQKRSATEYEDVDHQLNQLRHHFMNMLGYAMMPHVAEVVRAMSDAGTETLQ